MIKIIWLNYVDRIKMNLILTIQIVMMIVLANIVISSLNGRYILYKPFEKIFDNEGVVFSPEDGVAQTMLRFSKEDIEDICHNIIGDSVIHMSYGAGDVIKIGDTTKDVRIHLYEDEFVEGLELPLSDGKWKMSKNDSYIPCVISPNYYGIQTGDYITTENIDIQFKVVGVLTDITYEPNLSGWGSNVKELFKSYDGRQEDDLFIITKLSVADKLEKFVNPELNVYIDYEKGLTKDEIIKNNSILVNKGQVMTYKKIRKNSQTYIYKDLKELFPVMVGAAVIICIGIISAVSVSTESQFKNYKVFYLCGCTKRKCVIINVVGTSITMCMSVLLSTAVIMIYRNISNAASLSIIINKYNILASLSIIVVFELVACIIPAVLIGKKTIKELLYDRTT